MAETFIDLTQHTHRNVGKVEIAPIKFWLKVTAHRTPTPENCLKVYEKLVSDKVFTAFVESQILGLASIAVGGEAPRGIVATRVGAATGPSGGADREATTSSAVSA